MTDQQVLEAIRLRHRLREHAVGHARFDPRSTLQALRELGEHTGDEELVAEHGRWEVQLGGPYPDEGPLPY